MACDFKGGVTKIDDMFIFFRLRPVVAALNSEIAFFDDGSMVVLTEEGDFMRCVPVGEGPVPWAFGTSPSCGKQSVVFPQGDRILSVDVKTGTIQTLHVSHNHMVPTAGAGHGTACVIKFGRRCLALFEDNKPQRHQYFYFDVDSVAMNADNVFVVSDGTVAALNKNLCHVATVLNMSESFVPWLVAVNGNYILVVDKLGQAVLCTFPPQAGGPHGVFNLAVLPVAVHPYWDTSFAIVTKNSVEVFFCLTFTHAHSLSFFSTSVCVQIIHVDDFMEQF